MSIFDWVRGTKSQAEPAPRTAARSSLFSTDFSLSGPAARNRVKEVLADVLKSHRQTWVGNDGLAVAMDDEESGIALKTQMMPTNLPDALIMWFASQSFIGYQLCAMIAQHWLIDKACSMPGRDAIRRGYDIISIDGDELDPGIVKLLHRWDRAFRMSWQLEQFVRMGRIFGIRIAYFKVESDDPDYYAKPFNIDGVKPDSYRGIVQVDPYWTAPMLDQESASRPESSHFYEPTWWMISGQRYHRSHMVIYRNSDPPDLLKPQYLYGGVPVVQQIMERVYGAERTANEGPLLTMSKRLNVWYTDLSKAIANGEATQRKMEFWSRMRDNWGVKMGDLDGDKFEQFETSLADLDAVIMNQFQLVAAAARVPATKLLGTAPKGFDATGEYDESSYHEELESIQHHDLTPLLERHHALILKSYGAEGVDVQTTIQWRPLDAQTAAELADTNLKKAQTGAALTASGAIDAFDERARISKDPDSGYHQIGDTPPEPPPEDDGGDSNSSGA